jgi:hemolysin III
MAYKRKYSKDHSRHVTDEVINTTTHLVGSLLAIAGSALLISHASAAGKIWHIIAFSLYGFGLIGLFVLSTLHHGLNAGRKGNDLFRRLDYLAIFFLIAGTFSPLCLVVSRGVTGWTIFGVLWGYTLFGSALKFFIPRLPKWVTTSFYVVMGWFGLVLVWDIYTLLGVGALTLFFGSGVVYTLGSVIYTKEAPNPLPGKFGFHEIWHLLVLVAAGLHFLLMYWYVLPY